jgi:sRNA-binding protein
LLANRFAMNSDLPDPVSPSDSPSGDTAAAAAPAPAPEAKSAAPAAAPVDATAELKALFPALFTGKPKPVKLRIQADIQERAPGKFTKAQLSAFLRRYTGGTGYLIALTQAKTRFDLDGQPAGEITEEHLKAAQEELARRRGLKQEREQVEQQRHQLEAQQRRNRAQLLWDFERTTLTEANFCVLKGTTPEELPGLLEIARKERAEAPPAPPREARRDGPPPRRDDRRPGGGGRPEGRREGGRPPQRQGQGRKPDQPRRDQRAQPQAKGQAAQAETVPAAADAPKDQAPE